MTLDSSPVATPLAIQCYEIEFVFAYTTQDKQMPFYVYYSEQTNALFTYNRANKSIFAYGTLATQFHTNAFLPVHVLLTANKSLVMYTTQVTQMPSCVYYSGQINPYLCILLRLNKFLITYSNYPGQSKYLIMYILRPNKFLFTYTTYAKQIPVYVYYSGQTMAFLRILYSV